MQTASVTTMQQLSSMCQVTADIQSTIHDAFKQHNYQTENIICQICRWIHKYLHFRNIHVKLLTLQEPSKYSLFYIAYPHLQGLPTVTTENMVQERDIWGTEWVGCESYVTARYSIPIRDSNRFDSLCESIRLVKKSAFRFTSCHAVFLVYLLYSLSQKISWRHCLRRLIL